MFQRSALAGSGALALLALICAQATAASTVSGNVNCRLKGVATLKPGLPMNSPGVATKKFTTKVTLTGTLSDCTGTQSGTKKSLQIQGGSVTAKGTVVTGVGQPLPSCAGLLMTPSTLATPKTTVKFTNGTKTIAKSTLVGTLSTSVAGATVSFGSSGSVSKGAFPGQSLSVLGVLDLDAAALAAACSEPGGLANLSFTGVQGDSMLASPCTLSGGVNCTEQVDVGGYYLRMNCVGSGEPTVIFDSGTGSGLEGWTAVQPAVGGFTRACAYDRAGYGKSDPGPLPRTSEQIVSELHALLTNGRLPGPYVLVGHSFGGLNIHLYASTHPQEVAGLVFVDGTPAEFCDRWAASGLADVRPCIRCPIQSGALGSECLNIETSQAQVQSAGPLPDVPTVVFVAGAFQAHSGPPLTDAQSQQRENMWLELQTGLAHSVPDGMLVATDCPHVIQDCRPDLITSVVQTMVETIRIEQSGAPMVVPR